jgi:hypothetical protein
MKKPHKHRDLIIAWANGEIIELKNKYGWDYVDDPSWHEDVEYRIKPEVIRYRVAIFKSTEAIWCAVAHNEKQIEYFEETSFFKKWLTDWIEVEV